MVITKITMVITNAPARRDSRSFFNRSGVNVRAILLPVTINQAGGKLMLVSREKSFWNKNFLGAEM